MMSKNLDVKTVGQLYVGTIWSPWAVFFMNFLQNVSLMFLNKGELVCMIV